jgi:hypothetical protein
MEHNVDRNEIPRVARNENTTWSRMNTSWSGMKQHMVKNGMKYSDGQD